MRHGARGSQTETHGPRERRQLRLSAAGPEAVIRKGSCARRQPRARGRRLPSQRRSARRSATSWCFSNRSARRSRWVRSWLSSSTWAAAARTLALGSRCSAKASCSYGSVNPARQGQMRRTARARTSSSGERRSSRTHAHTAGSLTGDGSCASIRCCFAIIDASHVSIDAKGSAAQRCARDGHGFHRARWNATRVDISSMTRQNSGGGARRWIRRPSPKGRSWHETGPKNPFRSPTLRPRSGSGRRVISSAAKPLRAAG